MSKSPEEIVKGRNIAWIKQTRALFGTSLVATKAIYDLLLTLGAFDSRRKKKPWALLKKKINGANITPWPSPIKESVPIVAEI